MSEREVTVQELKARLIAQERAIILLAAFLQDNQAWVNFRDMNLSNWTSSIAASTGLSEEERKTSIDSLAETTRILTPNSKNYL